MRGQRQAVPARTISTAQTQRAPHFECFVGLSEPSGRRRSASLRDPPKHSLPAGFSQTPAHPGDAARLFRVHKNTVRAWVKSGLPTTDARRPILILGRELARFLHERRQRTRQQCQPGQFYCLRCRAPREPASRVAAYVPITSSSGNLRGQCGDCGVLMWRHVSVTRLSVVAGAIDVTFPEAQQRIEDNPHHSLNSDLAEEASTPCEHTARKMSASNDPTSCT